MPGESRFPSLQHPGPEQAGRRGVLLSPGSSSTPERAGSETATAISAAERRPCTHCAHTASKPHPLQSAAPGLIHTVETRDLSLPVFVIDPLGRVEDPVFRIIPGYTGYQGLYLAIVGDHIEGVADTQRLGECGYASSQRFSSVYSSQDWDLDLLHSGHAPSSRLLSDVQCQKAVTAYFSSKQLLPFGFCRVV